MTMPQNPALKPDSLRRRFAPLPELPLLADCRPTSLDRILRCLAAIRLSLHTPSRFAPQSLPPRVPQCVQRVDIALINHFGFGKRRHGTLDACLAQQVQRGERRAVGVVAHVVGFGAFELELGMKTGDLDDSFQLVFPRPRRPTAENR